MEVLSVKELLEAVDGKIYVEGNAKEFSSISIDTRNISPNSLFLAIKGKNFNGNDFVKLAVDNNASICVIDEVKFQNQDIKASTTIILVEDTKKALMDLATYYRSKLKAKIIGITGSTGKTSTKDLIAGVLGTKYKVFKTKGNFNNEIGLPLMIFSLDNSHEIAILEMGMSNLNEIHNLSRIAKPHIGVITNIGISHIENLKTRENILKAKLEITDYFGEGNTLIINNDNDLLQTIKEGSYNVIRCGLLEAENYSAIDIELCEQSVKFKVKENKEVISEDITVFAPGMHSVSNALLAIAIGRSFDLSYEDIKMGFTMVNSTSRRLDIIKKDSITIIDDCYNASPDSMRAAIDVLKNMGKGRKIAVLGSMFELGHESYNAHFSIGEYACINGIHELIAIGSFNEAYLAGFNSMEHSRKFDSKEVALTYIKNILREDDVILIKASRSMGFEYFVEALK